MNRSILSKSTPWVLFVGLGGLYWLTTNQVFSFDAITNAIACETNEPVRWFHPNHLLYPFIGVVWYRLERLLGYDGYAVYSLARLNAVMMGAAMALFFSALRRRVSFDLAIAATLFLSFTFAVWNYAVDGRAIGASVLFGVLVARYLLRLEDKVAGPHHLTVLACLSVLYVLVHGIAIFHVLPVAAWLVMSTTRSDRYRNAVLYLEYVLLGLLLSYLAVFLSFWRYYPNRDFLSWALGYAGIGGWSKAMESNFWSFQFGEILRGLWIGWQHAFYPIGEEVRWVIRLPAIFISITFAALVGASFFVSPSKGRARVTEYSFLWWGTLVISFLAFWSPGQEGFRLHALIPWTIAVVLVYADALIIKWFFIGFAGLLFGFNFTGPIYRNTSLANNLGYQILKNVNGRLNPGDIFLCGRADVVPGIEVLLPYFFPHVEGGTLRGRLFAYREPDLHPLAFRFHYKLMQGNKIYVADDLMAPEVQQDLEKRFRLPENAILSLLNSFEIEPAFALSNGHRVYELKHREDLRTGQMEKPDPFRKLIGNAPDGILRGRTSVRLNLPDSSNV